MYVSATQRLVVSFLSAFLGAHHIQQDEQQQQQAATADTQTQHSTLICISPAAAAAALSVSAKTNSRHGQHKQWPSSSAPASSNYWTMPICWLASVRIISLLHYEWGVERAHCRAAAAAAAFRWFGRDGCLLNEPGNEWLIEQRRI